MTSHADFESAFTHAPIGMAIVGLDGAWLRVNRALCDFVGYSEEELSGMTFQDITHPDDLEADLDYVHKLIADEIVSYQMEKRYFTKRGRQVWVRLAVSLVRDDQGEPLHFISQIEDVTERRRLELRLRELADRDPVTNLWNRRRFEEELTAQVARCRRYGERAALLMLDLDGFKTVNDSFGHKVGDRVIRAVGEALDGRLRGTDSVARIGGDEFAVLLPNVSEDQALSIAHALAQAIRIRAIPADGFKLHTSASIGVAFIDGEVQDSDSVLVAADRAMYAAKDAGRDRVAA